MNQFSFNLFILFYFKNQLLMKILKKNFNKIFLKQFNFPIMKSFGTIKEHVPHHADDTDHHDHDSHHHEEDHSHDHGHHHHHEPQGLHENQQFDKVSYNRILGSEQRDK